jgi:hypothetical protein
MRKPPKFQCEALKIPNHLNEKWDPRSEIFKRDQDLTEEDIALSMAAIHPKDNSDFFAKNISLIPEETSTLGPISHVL